MFRSTYYAKKLSDDARNTTKILFSSQPLPNQAISVSSRIDNKNKEKIIKSLTRDGGLKSTNDIVSRFAENKSNTFIVAKQKDYLT